MAYAHTVHVLGFNLPFHSLASNINAINLCSNVECTAQRVIVDEQWPY